MSEQGSPKKEVTINIQDKRYEEALDRIAELEVEKEDYKEKAVLASERLFEKKREELNAPDWIDDPETLKKWSESQGGKGGSGTVPLANQLQDSNSEKGFSDYGEMMSYIQTSERIAGSERAKEAKTVLNTLTERSLKALREKPQGFKMELKGSLKDFVNRQFREERLLRKEISEQDE